MVDVTGKAATVDFADALKSGFDAAMERIASLKINDGNTLVDAIAADVWATWDARDENAIVMDCDGLNGDLDDELPLAA